MKISEYVNSFDSIKSSSYPIKTPASLYCFNISLSVIFYNGLEERAEEFFEATSLGARQEDATMIQADRTGIDREITFQEVYMAILNLPVYVSGDGNASASKIVIKDHSGVVKGTYKASFDIENNLRKVTLSDAGSLNASYLVGKKDTANPMHNGLETLNWMIRDFAALVLPGASTTGSSNKVLKDNAGLIKNTTFSISYASDAIVYTLN